MHIQTDEELDPGIDVLPFESPRRTDIAILREMECLDPHMRGAFPIKNMVAKRVPFNHRLRWRMNSEILVRWKPSASDTVIVRYTKRITYGHDSIGISLGVLHILESVAKLS